MREQRMSALDKANLHRLGRAACKRGLQSGELSLLDAFENPYVQTMLVADLLMSKHKVGAFKVQRAMRQAGVSPFGWTVERLTERQKLALSEWLV